MIERFLSTLLTDYSTDQTDHYEQVSKLDAQSEDFYSLEPLGQNPCGLAEFLPRRR